MKKILLTVALILVTGPALSQVAAIKAVLVIGAAAEATNAARALRGTSKLTAAEGAANVTNVTKKTISAETKATLATRSAQIASKCMSYSKSNNREEECKQKSAAFQQCVASALERSGVNKLFIERCAKIHQ